MDLKSKLVDIEVHTGPTELLEYTICNETDEKRFSNRDKKDILSPTKQKYIYLN